MKQRNLPIQSTENLPTLGPEALDPTLFGKDAWRVTLWSPWKSKPTLLLYFDKQNEVASHRMSRLGMGYWRVECKDVPAGTRYLFLLGDTHFIPDPASRSQPLGSEGPSVLVRDDFPWTDQGFRPPSMRELSLYELHVGTFTPEGTLDSAIERLDALAELGVTAVELMPLAQCPGERNWGYDGVFPFAVQHSYGGPQALSRFVDAAHARGLAVYLDVVYNHLGPEGNCLRRFGPYFRRDVHTPWGEALNFDGPDSDHVRHYFLENARHWFLKHHIDGLRLDAVQTIYDNRPDPFLRDLARLAHEIGRQTGSPRHIIAESPTNDPALVRPESLGGLGLDGVWSEDAHHAVHSLLTGERNGYYEDYGGVEHVAETLRHGFGFRGRYSAYFACKRGEPCADLPASAFVAYMQNHDQVGNRPQGERLSRLVDFPRLKLAAALLLWSPFTPLLFMGEEYGEETPFFYFIDHTSKRLTNAVRRGREIESQAFGWQTRPPHPDKAETFEQSILDWSRRDSDRGRALLAFYSECLRLRREYPALTDPDMSTVTVETSGEISGDVLILRRTGGPAQALALFNCSAEQRGCEIDGGGLDWRLAMDTTEKRFGGPGNGPPARLPANAASGRGRTDGLLALPAWSAALYLESGPDK